MRCALTFAGLLATLVVAANEARADDWPQFRGPNMRTKVVCIRAAGG